MSLYELMICKRELGGCGHARHRHTKAPGSPVQNFHRGIGGCRAVGSDGHCPCPMFREEEIQNAAGNSAEGS